MLKHRIITAIILIPIFIALVLFLPPLWFAVMTGLAVLWGAYEWSAFMGIKKLPLRVLYPILMLLFLEAALIVPVVYILETAAIWWLIAFFLVLFYPRLSGIWGKSLVIRGIMGVLVLAPCWLAINFIRDHESGAYTLLFLFVLIWGADTGAYFAGKKWGKNKLAPAVSPGKTWQGLGGAIAVTMVIVLVTLYATKVPHPVWFAAMVLSMVTVLVSVLGDLFESMLKRNVGLKDSGRLLPGHGGMLDRIDSLTAAAPIFALGALLLGKFFH
ncbi:MAG: phosphatidate cytidylyltransferase [Gammaproteobacteria bacterium]